MTHAEMMERMSARELAAWRVYDGRVEPLGDSRADLRAGSICATIASAATGERHTPADFTLQFRRPAPEEQNDNVKAIMGLFTKRSDDVQA